MSDWKTFLFTVAFVGVPCSAILASEWQQWRGPARNGHAESAMVLSPSMAVTQKWEAAVGTGFSSFAYAKGHVYTAGNQDDQDSIWCLKAEDGSVVWKHSYPAPLDPNLFEGGPTATPTVVGDRVYVISRKGNLFCLSAQNGEVIWERTVSDEQKGNIPTWGYAGSALVLNDRVYYNVGSNGLCVNAQTGETIWESPANELPGYTSPLPVTQGERMLLLLETEKALKAVNPETGEVHWEHRWVTRYGINAADPILISDRRLLLTSGYQKGAVLLEFDHESAKEIWKTREIRSQMSPGVLIGDLVYAIDGDAGRSPRLVCAEAETGRIKWFANEVASGSVIAVGNQPAVLTEAGEFLVLPEKADTFSPLYRSQVLEGKCWTPMAYGDNMFFARNAEGRVVCLSVSLSENPSEKVQTPDSEKP